MIHDISMKISPDMPVYKAKPEKRPRITRDSDFGSGGARESRIEMNMHTGTHVDMPLHYLEGGDAVDTLDLRKVVVPCRVYDFSQVQSSITQKDLEQKSISGDEFVLLKTANSYRNILEGAFIYLDESGAAYLRNLKVPGVGIDSLGIERDQPGHPTHKTLLGAGILILEGLRLRDIAEGGYILISAPVYVAGAEASPVRAFLLDRPFCM